MECWNLSAQLSELGSFALVTLLVMGGKWSENSMNAFSPAAPIQQWQQSREAGWSSHRPPRCSLGTPSGWPLQLWPGVATGPEDSHLFQVSLRLHSCISPVLPSCQAVLSAACRIWRFPAGGSRIQFSASPSDSLSSPRWKDSVLYLALKDLSQDQWPLQNENAGPLSPTCWGISRGQQRSIKPSIGPVPRTGHRPLKPALGPCQVLNYLSFGCKCPQRVDPPFKKVQISGSNKQSRFPESPFNGTLKNRLWKALYRHLVS